MNNILHEKSNTKESRIDNNKIQKIRLNNDGHSQYHSEHNFLS